MSATREIPIGGFAIGGAQPLFVIAGPCVIENEAHTRALAEKLAEITAAAGLRFIFKASYDKANRSSLASYRGPGLKDGLAILKRVKQSLGVPLLTDIHAVEQAAPAAEVCDVIQIPAFLCRQTDILLAAGKTGRVVHLKKGQFVSPWEMANAVEKVASTGNENVLIAERGSSFGYQNLVVDMRSFAILRRTGCPVVFDVTHALQLPGGEGKSSGGQPEFIEPLARAGVAAGVDGVFVEVHENPPRALSDGSNALRLELAPSLFGKLAQLSALVRKWEGA